MWMDFQKLKIKRNLANQNRHVDKFCPHSTLTIWLQLTTTFEHEVVKFARMWCDTDPVNLINEIRAIKEIFETENKDDMTWMVELMANKYTAENIDRLIYLYYTIPR